MAWLDDQFVITGARDKTLALWRVTDKMVDDVSSADIPSHHYIKPLMKKECKSADKVRSLCYNHRSEELAVISMNGFIHCWDANRFRQVGSNQKGP